MGLTTQLGTTIPAHRQLGGLIALAIAQGAMFVSKFQNQSRNNWNTAGNQINNEVNTLPPKQWNQGLDFQSANSDYLLIGNLSSGVNHIAFWINLDSTTEPIMNFSSTKAVDASSGSIALTGFTGTVKVDGVETTTVSASTWHFVEIIPDSEQTITGLEFAKVMGYGDFVAKDLIFLSAENTSLFGTTDIIGLENKVAVYPLADYNVANGARTAGDIALDYSGNDNHGVIQGTSVTPVYTTSIGYTVCEDAYNRYVDFDGVNDEVTGLTMTGFTGDGYIEVDTVLETYTGSGAFLGVVGDSASDVIYIENANGGRIWWRINGTSLIWTNLATTDNFFDGKIHTIRVQRVGSNATLTIDGVTPSLVPTKTVTTVAVPTYDFIGSRLGALYYNQPIFRVDMNGTVYYPNTKIGGTTSGSPRYIYVHDIGNSIDLFGDTISFTGSAAPDGKLFTGGCIKLASANSDYVDCGNLGNIRRVSFWLKLEGTSEFIMGLNNTVYIDALTGTLRVNGISTETIYVNGVETTNISTDWAYVNITFSSALTADSVLLGRYSLTYGDVSLKDVQFYSSVLEDTIYNSPNSLVSVAQSSCIAAYDFNQGTYSAGSPAIDVSGNGNHGTVQGATSQMALNNIEVGSQMALHGWNLYGYVTGTGTISTTGTTLTGVGTSFTTQLAVGDLIWGSGEIVKVASITDNTNAVLESAPLADFSGDTFVILDQDQSTTNILIPSTTNSSTTDIFGNTVQRPWKAGALNFTPFSHQGMVVGTTGNFNAPQYSIIALYMMKSASTAKQILLSNRTAGDGITYSILATELADIENEVGGTPANDSADTTLIAGTNYVLAVDIQSDGTAEHFDGTDSVAIASDSTATKLNNSVGQSSTALRVGALGDGTLPLNEGGVSVILFNRKQSLAIKEKFRKELIKLIP